MVKGTNNKEYIILVYKLLEKEKDERTKIYNKKSRII